MTRVSDDWDREKRSKEVGLFHLSQSADLYRPYSVGGVGTGEGTK